VRTLDIPFYRKHGGAGARVAEEPAPKHVSQHALKIMPRGITVEIAVLGGDLRRARY